MYFKPSEYSDWTNGICYKIQSILYSVTKYYFKVPPSPQYWICVFEVFFTNNVIKICIRFFFLIGRNVMQYGSKDAKNILWQKKFESHCSRV